MNESNQKNKNKMKNTNVEQVKELLSNIDPQTLMYAISQMNEIYVPQCYFGDHAEYYGFESIKEMKEMGDAHEAYCYIDEMMKYVSTTK